MLVSKIAYLCIYTYTHKNKSNRFVVNPSIVFTVETQKSVRPITTALEFKGDAANSYFRNIQANMSIEHRASSFHIKIFVSMF